MDVPDIRLISPGSPELLGLTREVFTEYAARTSRRRFRRCLATTPSHRVPCDWRLSMAPLQDAAPYAH